MVLYGVVVIAVLLAAVVGTNLWQTRNLFAHIREPLAELMQGIHHIQNGDLNAPIAYTKNDEFRPACDAVDEMAAACGRRSRTPPRTRSCCKRCGAWATGCIQFKKRLNAQGPLLKKFRYTGYSSRIFLGRVPDDPNSISLMGLQLAVLPGLCTLGFGVLAGVAISISAIRAALQKYRSQMIWLILGLMLGSLYAIANGPASLATPRPALSMATFQPVGFVLSATVLLALEGARMMMERKEQPGVPIVKGAKQA